MMLQIYCGDGKGKTTAALGQALRAAGAGMRVHIIQFMKGSATGELESLKKISEITLGRLERDYGFVANMTREERAQVTARHSAMLREAKEILPKIDMLILDEFNSAYKYGLMDRELADNIVKNADKTEIILTGRGPAKKFLDAADYVSEILCVKHPYARGIKARQGIEY